MFEDLRENRSVLMGLAILGVAFFHAPFVIHNVWLQALHGCLNCGVDLFLFLSGLGACHSIESRGGQGYLLKRAKRILPGLYPVLILWCGVMLALGLMSGTELLGNLTLLGWWLGMNNQLNWYFSAVWLFFLLAVPLYALFRRTRRPVILWLGLVVLSVALGILCPSWWHMTAVSRLPIFITGMLFGRLEQQGLRNEEPLQVFLLSLIPLGAWLALAAYWGYGYVYGYSLGMWWYPYALVIPGGAVLTAWLAARLRGHPIFRPMLRPVEWLGESSSEILMIHVGVYKVFSTLHQNRNRYWLAVMVGCLAAGCAYHYLVVPRLRLPREHAA